MTAASDIRNTFLKEFFRELEARGIPYVVSRGHGTIALDDSKDIDILSSPGCFRTIETVYRTLAARFPALPFALRTQGKNMYIKCIFFFDSPGDDTVSGLYIHVMGFITLKTSSRFKALKGAGRRIWIDEVERGVASVSGIDLYVPSPKFQALFLLAKFSQVEKARYLQEIDAIVEANGLGNWADEVGVRDILVGVHDVTPSDVLLRDSFPVLDKMSRSLLGAGKGERLSEWMPLLYSNATSLFRKDGVLVFFSGPDGAGKTTTSDALAEFLKSNLKTRIRRFKHLYPVSNLLSKRTARVQAKIRGVDIGDKHAVERDRGESLAWKMRRLVGLLYILLQVFPGYLYARYLNYRGVTVIVDTSFFDAFVKGHRPAFPLLQKISVPLIPTGDSWLLMRAAPADIVARKPELSAGEIEMYYKIIEAIASQSRRSPIDIPADVSVAHSLSTIVRSMASTAN